MKFIKIVFATLYKSYVRYAPTKKDAARSAIYIISLTLTSNIVGIYQVFAQIFGDNIKQVSRLTAVLVLCGLGYSIVIFLSEKLSRNEKYIQVSKDIANSKIKISNISNVSLTYMYFLVSIIFLVFANILYFSDRTLLAVL